MNDGTKLFGLLLVGFGVYKLLNPTPGFLVLENPRYPFVVLIVFGLYLFAT